jgi:hypothetical protein
MTSLSVGEIFSFAFGQVFTTRTFKTIIVPVAAVYTGISLVFLIAFGGVTKMGSGGGGGLFHLVFTSLAVIVALVRVHRQYLLDEERPLLLMDTLGVGYYWRYAWRALILTLIIMAPFLITGLLFVASPGLGVLGFIGTTAFLIYTIRWQLVLPAAAIGRHLTFDESATRFDGHKMSYFWASLLLALVFVAIDVFFRILMGVSVIASAASEFGSLSLSALVWLVLDAVLAIYSSAVYAFALSFIYKHTEPDNSPAEGEVGANQTYGRPDYGGEDS